MSKRPTGWPVITFPVGIDAKSLTTWRGIDVPRRVDGRYVEHWEGQPGPDSTLVGLTVDITVELHDDEPVVGRLTVEVPPGIPLTNEFLAQIDVQKIGDVIFAAAVGQIELEAAAAAGLSPGMRPDVVAAMRRGVRNPRRSINETFLRKVAEIARDNPETPNKAVREELHTGTRNASRWLAQAEKYLSEEEQ